MPLHCEPSKLRDCRGVMLPRGAGSCSSKWRPGAICNARGWPRLRALLPLAKFGAVLDQSGRRQSAWNKRQNHERIIRAVFIAEANFASPPETKPGVILRVPHEHNVAVSRLATGVQPGANQCRANALALMRGEHGDGGQAEALDLRRSANDRNWTEQDVADDVPVQFGDERDGGMTSSAQGVHQAGFLVGRESGRVNGVDRRRIVGALGADDSHCAMLNPTASP